MLLRNGSAVSSASVFLSRWKILETSDGSRHLVGYDSLDRGCVSSTLVSFNQAMRPEKRVTALPIDSLARPGALGGVFIYPPTGLPWNP